MPRAPKLIAGLSELAPDYDALLCDVWGVLHNGHEAFADAGAALAHFRCTRGPVVLLSNAPRAAADLERQFTSLGVRSDCYDAIVTSGDATRADLAARARAGRLMMFHLGPARDRAVYEGLDVALADEDEDEANIILCTGLYDDEAETPDDYVDLLSRLAAKRLPMLCANPDIRVQRGGELLWCAGALAEAYEKSGGAVVYYGKPHPSIYSVARASAPRAKKWLAIGDGLMTDIRGAQRVGIDALFIADGVHGEEVEPYTQDHLAHLFDEAQTHARAAMRRLVW